MKQIKIITLALAAGGLLSVAAAPAFAQHYNNHGNSGGYVSQNHNGYSGKSGHGNKYNNSHGRDWKDKGHSKYKKYDNYGHNKYGHNDRFNHSYGHHSSHKYNNSYHGSNQYYGHYGYKPYAPPPPRYAWNPGQRVVWNPHFQSRNHYYRPRYNVGTRITLARYPQIHDYGRYGLYQPPRGYNWVRCDNDAYLTAAGTGLVAGIIVGALISG